MSYQPPTDFVPTRWRGYLDTATAAGDIKRLPALLGAVRAAGVARRAALLEEVSQEIHAHGGLCAALALDLRLPNAPPAVVSTALQRYGGIEVVVHAAGTIAAGSLLDQTAAQLAEQWEIHVLAPLRLTREALPALRAGRGQGHRRDDPGTPPPGAAAYRQAHRRSRQPRKGRSVKVRSQREQVRSGSRCGKTAGSQSATTVRH